MSSILFHFCKIGELAVTSADLSWHNAVDQRGYGLHSVLPQLVVPTPPSARATVGTTRVLRRRIAALRAKSTRFTVICSFGTAELKGDIFTPSKNAATGCKTFERSEFVTEKTR